MKRQVERAVGHVVERLVHEHVVVAKRRVRRREQVFDELAHLVPRLGPELHERVQRRLREHLEHFAARVRALQQVFDDAQVEHFVPDRHADALLRLNSVHVTHVRLEHKTCGCE